MSKNSLKLPYLLEAELWALPVELLTFCKEMSKKWVEITVLNRECFFYV
jgi:hypothetical protein